MKILNKKYIAILVIGLLFLVPKTSDAASIFVSTDVTELSLNEEFEVSVNINSEDGQINAAQATIYFPSDVLEVVSVNKDFSTFNFWVEEPNISNSAGKVDFIGGTPRGVTGDSLFVLNIKFKAIGSGSADISVSEAVVTASDGKGTNVLTDLIGASFVVGTDVVSISEEVVEEDVFDPTAVVVEAPKEIVREAVRAENAPEAPVVSVPMYPDQEEWYSHIAKTIVQWDVPSDIIKVGIEIDQDQNTVPGASESVLVSGKDIGELEEGVWYVHVQFKNNIGWGDTAHYKIAIDQTDPIPFELGTSAIVTDNPSPELFIYSQDALSGVAEVKVFVDTKEYFTASSTTFLLPPLKPGSHEILVRVLDHARNSSESSIKIEILPLPSPIITFLTESISGGEQVFISGKAVPSGFVDIVIKSKSGSSLYQETYTSDNSGGWSANIDANFSTGKYIVTATSRDIRGAISYSTDGDVFKVKPKTVISLGFADLGWFEIFVLLMAIVFSGGGFMSWKYSTEKTRSSAYSTIATRDVTKLTTLLIKELDELEKWHAKQKYSSKSVKTEVEYRYKKLRTNMIKMNKSLVTLIGKIK